MIKNVKSNQQFPNLTTFLNYFFMTFSLTVNISFLYKNWLIATFKTSFNVAK